MAKIETKSELAGTGAFVQLVSFICGMLWFPYFVLPGIVGFVIGSRMAVIPICGCGNRVEKTSKMCPTCKNLFE
jgi:hypothetical protein